jgi:hypothetical protein
MLSPLLVYAQSMVFPFLMLSKSAKVSRRSEREEKEEGVWIA